MIIILALYYAAAWLMIPGVVALAAHMNPMDGPAWFAQVGVLCLGSILFHHVANHLQRVLLAEWEKVKDADSVSTDNRS